jgi:hypothetical protein
MRWQLCHCFCGRARANPTKAEHSFCMHIENRQKKTTCPKHLLDSLCASHSRTACAEYTVSLGGPIPLHVKLFRTGKYAKPM